MKKSHNTERLFRDAERIKPSPALWRRIAERSSLAGSGAPERSLWEAPLMRMAAAIALIATVAGVATVGVMRSKAGTRGEGAMASAPAASLAESAEEVFDPDLLGWQADLGEMGELDLEAEEAGEVL